MKKINLFDVKISSQRIASKPGLRAIGKLLGEAYPAETDHDKTISIPALWQVIACNIIDILPDYMTD
jgi:hypothetical protein